VRTSLLALAVVGLLVVPACSAGAPAPGAGAPPTTLTVFAAASLKDTFTTLGQRFGTDNPGTEVTFNFAGSSDLAQQIVQGAPADVFAAASDATMKTVTDAGAASGSPSVFATNVLQIAVAPGNPKGLTGLTDLTRPDIKVVQCAPQVPCGAAAQKAEKAAGVTVRPVSEEPDVKSALSKVSTGNADAALVYVTDVLSAKGAVDGVSFPESAQSRTNYPIVTVKASRHAELAQRFIELVKGEVGQRQLQAAGFGPA